MSVDPKRLAELVRASAKASLDQLVLAHRPTGRRDGSSSALSTVDYALLLNAIANNAAQVIALELEGAS